MLIIPIRTESVRRRSLTVNYLLIAANVVLFLLLNQGLFGKAAVEFTERHLVFHSDQPAFHQFLTYQFLHGNVMHLVFNMLFLWVFGNGVNGKMGDGPYLLFYLAGGVFAAWGHAAIAPEAFQMVGASGAIAAVTAAYLALFPRSHVTVLVWLFLFIHFFEVPAMIFIGAKIMVDMIAPGLGGSSGVAHATHLAGYLFGFVGALGMLFVRALPRDQFDILALWKRWHQRRGFAAAMADPAAAARAEHGTVARIVPPDAEQRAQEERRFNQVADLRNRISEQLERRDVGAAAALYEQLADIDPKQCLSERDQLEIAREFYRTGRFARAAAVFDRFVDCHPYSTEAGDVRLLLGIIYARDLHQYEDADRHLTRSMDTLRDQTRREQCVQWLRTVRTAVGRPAPDV